jgi:hypothetical protein
VTTATLADLDPDRERLRAARLESEFRRRYCVREYHNGGRHVLAVLRSGGAPRRDVLDAYDLLTGPPVVIRGREYRHSGLPSGWGAFDHGGVYGRARRPLVLVGHPYQLSADDHMLLDTLAALGLDVRTDGESFYGFGTFQVLVANPAAGIPAVLRPLDPDYRSPTHPPEPHP